MSIFVSGSLAYDYIMNFPDSFKNHILPEQIHILNVCFVVGKLAKTQGGTAGNIAYTVQMLGGTPLLASALGSDNADYLSFFKQHHIATDHIVVDPSQLSASAYITTDKDDNQITAFYNGPLGRAAEVLPSKIKSRPALAIISPTSKDVMIAHLNDARSAGIPTVFDPGQQITAFSDIELQKMVSAADIVIGNDYEMKILEDRTGWDGEKLLTQTKILITTFGEKGSIITPRHAEPITIKPCAPSSVDDPTGAGDAYRAGFCVGYEKGLDLKTCGQIGAVAASYAIENYGTQSHTFTIKEFTDRYEKTYKEKIAL